MASCTTPAKAPAKCTSVTSQGSRTGGASGSKTGGLRTRSANAASSSGTVNPKKAVSGDVHQRRPQGVFVFSERWHRL